MTPQEIIMQSNKDKQKHSFLYKDRLKKSIHYSIWQKERKRIVLALILLVIGLFITAAASYSVMTDIQKDARKNFEFACSEIQVKMTARLHAITQLLRSQVLLFEKTGIATRTEWRNAYKYQMIEKNLPGIQGLGYSEIIQPNDLTKHEQKIRREGFPQYEVKPGNKREIYTSIIFLEPFAGRNLRAFGYDMFSEKIRREAMERARDFNSSCLSGKITLVQETNDDIQAGALIYVPVYKKNEPIESLVQRRRAIQGWVYSPCRMNDLMKGILGGYGYLNERNIHLVIFDDSLYSKNSILYDSRVLENSKQMHSALFSSKSSLTVSNHKWFLHFYNDVQKSSGLDYSKVWVVTIGGSSVCILLFILYTSLITTNLRVRKLAEELTHDLRESESKYKTIFNNEIYSICIFDSDSWKILDVNNAHCSIYGYSKAELLSGMSFNELTSDVNSSVSSFKNISFEESLSIPLAYHKKKNGLEFPVEIVAGLYYWKDRRVTFVLTKEITLRKQAEDDLKQSEKKFRSIIDSSPIPYALNDDLGRITYLNEAFINTFGYTMEDLKVISDWWPRAYPDPEYRRSVISRWDKHFEKARLEGKSFEPMEVIIKCKDGTIRTVIVSASSIIDQFTGVHLVIFYDITERKKAEDSLHNTKWRLERIIEGTHIGTWEWNVQTGETIFNEVWAQIIGYTLAELEPVSIKTWETFAHPDDLQKSGGLLERHFSGELTHYEFESRMKHKNGHWIWVYDRGCIMTRTGDGKPLWMFGTHTDITERKNTEMQMQEILLDLKKSQNIAHMGKWKLDLATNRFNSSEEALHLFGFSFNQNPTFQEVSDCIYPDDRGIASSALKNSLHTRKPYSIEIRINRKDTGELRNILSSAEIQFDLNGKPISVIGINQDITERKLAEEAIKQSEIKFRSIIDSSPISYALNDNHGNITYLNQAFIQIFGYTMEELKTISDWWPRAYPDIKYREEVIATWQSHLEKAKQDCTPFEPMEVFVNCKDGKIRTVLASASSMTDRFEGIHLVILYDITERMEAVEALRNRNILFSKLSSNVPGMIFQFMRRKDGTFCVPFATEAIKQLYNCSPQDVKDDFTPMANVILPDDFGIINSSIEYSAEHLTDFQCEYRVQIPGENVKWLFSQSTPEKMADGSIIWHGFNTDITERIQKEKSLKLYKSRLETSMFATNIAWWEMDVKTGNIIFNKRKAEMLGYLPELFTHYKDFMNLVHPDDYETTMQAMRDHFIGKKDLYETDYRIKTKSGEYKWFRDKGVVTEWDENGSPLMVCGIVADITDTKEIQQALEKNLIKELELNELKNRFISMVSHEFRTPLTSILASSDFLEMGGEKYDTEKKAKQFARIRRSVDYMINMLNEVLMINKMDLGKLEVEFEKTNLSDYCKELLNEMSQLYPNIKSNVIINLGNAFYNIDTVLMRNILGNLLSNAFKFNFDKGMVDFYVYEVDNNLVFKITDTGFGIPDEENKRIYEPFNRMTNVKHIKGTGLGMSIIKNSVELLNGDIAFSSKINEGTIFTVTIPVAELNK